MVNEIEHQIEERTGRGSLADGDEDDQDPAPRRRWLRRAAGVMLRKYPRRTILGVSLIVSQAFLYNGVFFTFPLVLRNFYGVPRRSHRLLHPAVCAQQFSGAGLLGRFFDTIGRRPMIAATYTISAILLAVSGYLFQARPLTPITQTILWALVFFFASSAASSAYLTVSEIFPVELRGMVIALFFATGTLVGGTVAPGLFGRLIDTGSRTQCLLRRPARFGPACWRRSWSWHSVGVKAERASLEEIAEPLSAVDDDKRRRIRSAVQSTARVLALRHRSGRWLAPLSVFRSRCGVLEPETENRRTPS